MLDWSFLSPVLQATNTYIIDCIRVVRLRTFLYKDCYRWRALAWDVGLAYCTSLCWFHTGHNPLAHLVTTTLRILHHTIVRLAPLHLVYLGTTYPFALLHITLLPLKSLGPHSFHEFNMRWRCYNIAPLKEGPGPDFGVG